MIDSNVNKSVSIIDSFKEFEISLIGLKLSISPENKKLLASSENYLDYSKAIYSNQKNHLKFKMLVTVELIKLITIILSLILVFVNIQFILNKQIHVLFFVLIGSTILMVLVLIWEGLLFDYRGWILATSIRNKHGIKKNPKSYFVSEYLKSKFECLNNNYLSKERIDDIKNNFVSLYYKFDKKEFALFEFKKSIICKKFNENNYIDKANKIGKITNSFWLYGLTFFIIEMFTIIMGLSVFVF